MEVMQIKNISLSTVDAEFYFMKDQNANTFLLDPPNMTLKSGESEVLCCAYAHVHVLVCTWFFIHVTGVQYTMSWSSAPGSNKIGSCGHLDPHKPFCGQIIVFR